MRGLKIIIFKTIALLLSIPIFLCFGLTKLLEILQKLVTNVSFFFLYCQLVILKDLDNEDY